ncbi:MAG: 4a-hydroxytetrahydrobiopterin dehydratase [Candidatus Levybacteria bacterium]|nr:4a-hydroxytetrahydrobiopterin dehydratase [Candidatus Levybacteria bacterium]
MSDLIKKHCIPCESGEPPISDQKEEEMLKQVQHDKGEWILLRDGTHKLRRQFTFKDFKEAIAFVNKVAEVAEEQGHHPDIYIFYNKVQIDLFTHAVGGLSENDFIMAAKIDLL